MKRRCSPKAKEKDRPHYYDRGIRVCDEWLLDGLLFDEWALANGYEPGLCIDRIDNDQGYRPDNCRWVTVCQNNRNRGATKFSSEIATEIRRRFEPHRVTAPMLAREYGTSPSYIYQILSGKKWK